MVSHRASLHRNVVPGKSELFSVQCVGVQDAQHEGFDSHYNAQRIALGECVTTNTRCSTRLHTDHLRFVEHFLASMMKVVSA